MPHHAVHNSTLVDRRLDMTEQILEERDNSYAAMLLSNRLAACVGKWCLPVPPGLAPALLCQPAHSAPWLHRVDGWLAGKASS